MRDKKSTTPPILSIAAATIVAAVLAASTALPNLAQVGPDYDWKAELEQTLGEVAPVVVEQGRLSFLVESNCPPIIEKYGRCFGNNPASPYGTYELGDFTGPADSFRWRLAENQGVFFIGITPPTSRYFSIQPYPFSRHESKLHLPPNGNEGKFCDDPDPSPLGCRMPRRTLLAAMGLSLNHLEVLTDRGDEDSFGRFTIVVTTANMEVERRVRQLLPGRLVELGYSPNVINIDQIPCESVAGDGTCDDSDPRNLILGSEPESDDFIMAIRLAMTRSLSAQKAYMDAPPAAVMRVTFPDLAGSFTPYPRAELLPQPAAHKYNETPYEDALDWLARKIRDAYAPGGKMLTFSKAGRPYYQCLDQESSCNAACEDARYSSGPDIPKGCVKKGQSVYVVGVNHSLAGPYSYFSLSIRSKSERHEIGYITDSHYVVTHLPGEPVDPDVIGDAPPYLEGSVEHFLPRSQFPRPDELDAQLGRLFVAEIALSCDPPNNPHCLEFSPEDLDGNLLGFQERTYLNTIVRTAPESPNFIQSRAVVPAAAECL